jgi:hypothetical protein
MGTVLAEFQALPFAPNFQIRQMYVSRERVTPYAASTDCLTQLANGANAGLIVAGCGDYGNFILSKTRRQYYPTRFCRGIGATWHAARIAGQLSTKSQKNWGKWANSPLWHTVGG